jgi:hypothetical protein
MDLRGFSWRRPYGSAPMNWAIRPTVDPANLRRQLARIDPLGRHEISTPVVVTSTGEPAGGQ